MYRVKMGRIELKNPVEYDLFILANNIETALAMANQYENSEVKGFNKIISISVIADCIIDATK